MLLLCACAAPAQQAGSADPGSVAIVCDRVPKEAQDPVEKALAEAVRQDCPSFARAFLASLRDAAVIEDGETMDSLRTVPDPGGRLITRQRDGRVQLMVTVWSDAASIRQYYKPAPGSDDPKTGQTPPGRPVVWVTLTPELRDWCRASLPWPDKGVDTQGANALRVNQRLGIAPFSLKSQFAELWVDFKSGVIRPCPDPDPATSSCGDAFPDTVDQPGLTEADYFRWFGDTVGSSYRPTGAPWTRLGYTYDWGPDNDSVPPYGASEFMLAPGTAFEVNQVYSVLDYCRP